MRQIANLAKLFGMLLGANDIPLHFLKVLDFSQGEGESALSKPQQLFLYVLFDFVFANHSKEQLKVVFVKGLTTKSQQAQLK